MEHLKAVRKPVQIIAAILAKKLFADTGKIVNFE